MMLGALDGLEKVAGQRLATPTRQNEPVGALPPRSIQIRCRDLRKQIESLYEHLFAETVAGEREADVELLLLGASTAEDMGHKPYRYPFQHQER